MTAWSTSGDHGRPRETSGDHRRRRLLVYEYKLRLTCAQAAAIEEAIRTTSVPSATKPCAGGWMDETAAVKSLEECGRVWKRLARGLAVAREQGRCPQDAGEPTELTEPRGAVGRTGT
jgi:hypothetical protein